MPYVSVLLPAFNAEGVIADAIHSVLHQTYRDFELIVVDDGSTDRTAEVVAASSDRRVRLLRMPANEGIVAALNTGLEAASGELIARIDADDLAMPDRLQRQVMALQANPRVGLVGTGWKKVLLRTGVLVGTFAPLPQHAALRLQLLFGNPFPHVTTMFRREVAQELGSYTAETWPVEDYDLWQRMSAHALVAALPQPLTIVRQSDGGISASNTSSQECMVATISSRGLEALLGYPPPQVLLSGGRVSCSEVGDAQRLVLKARRLVGEECSRRGVPLKGLDRAASRVLMGWGYRDRDRVRCRRVALTLAIESPTVAAHLASLWAHRRAPRAKLRSQD